MTTTRDAHVADASEVAADARLTDATFASIVEHTFREGARLVPAAPTSDPAEDPTPWVAGPTADDEWKDSPSIGASAFQQRCRQVALLTAEDEVMLAKRIEAGVLARAALDEPVERTRTERRALEHVVREGDEAFERMVLANTRLVASLAAKYLPRAHGGMTFDDLQQAGMFGLIRAVQKFDYTAGTKFSTYATWWIRQAIGRAADDEGRLIRFPVHVLDTARAIDAARRNAGLTWDEAVRTPEALGGASAREVATAATTRYRHVSLETLVEDLDVEDDADNPVDLLVSRLGAETLLAAAFEHLEGTPGLGVRAVEVLQMRFGITTGEPMTLEAIGQHFGVTRERIRQIEKKAREVLVEWAECQGWSEVA